ncbi:MAG: hypothetical protein OEU62_07540, partial [Gammaproteobacteria bacterium]|nr:hypothetical protein [Gammaproteobacteria bacterium]
MQNMNGQLNIGASGYLIQLETQLLVIPEQLLPTFPDGCGALQSFPERMYAFDFGLPGPDPPS